jgi:hypothetical protein
VRYRGGFTVAITDELSDEEQAIMGFLKRYFEAAGMPNALWILNESENLSDVDRDLRRACRAAFLAIQNRSMAESSAYMMLIAMVAE